MHSQQNNNEYITTRCFLPAIHRKINTKNNERYLANAIFSPLSPAYYETKLSLLYHQILQRDTMARLKDTNPISFCSKTPNNCPVSLRINVHRDKKKIYILKRRFEERWTPDTTPDRPWEVTGRGVVADPVAVTYLMMLLKFLWRLGGLGCMGVCVVYSLLYGVCICGVIFVGLWWDFCMFGGDVYDDWYVLWCLSVWCVFFIYMWSVYVYDVIFLCMMWYLCVCQ